MRTLGKFQNKWLMAAIPALLIHCSIGTVYCWSLLSESIVEYVGGGVQKSTIEWAFSLAIFFLGMSAAFLGPMVERDIHKASLLSTICFTAGMAGTGVCIYLKCLPGIFIFYGVIMGIGLGTGYLAPVKTLMLWFKEQKGLATGLAIAGFGLAKVIASPIIEYLLKTVGIVSLFLILSIVYFFFMFLGHLLLQKPEGWVEAPAGSQTKLKGVIKNRNFIGIWLMFYCNITCGLALISQEKGIVKAMGLAAMVGVISSLTAVFNAGGRLCFSAWGDHLTDRNTVYKWIFGLSILFTGLTVVTNGIGNGIALIVIPMLFVINAGYGGGFSNVPALLSDRFGMESISQIHGLVLTAWAFAGLTGNQAATFIVNHSGEFVKDADGVLTNPIGYQNVLIFVLALFIVAAIICAVLVRPDKKVRR